MSEDSHRVYALFILSISEPDVIQKLFAKCRDIHLLLSSTEKLYILMESHLRVAKLPKYSGTLYIYVVNLKYKKASLQI